MVFEPSPLLRVNDFGELVSAFQLQLLVLFVSLRQMWLGLPLVEKLTDTDVVEV